MAIPLVDADEVKTGRGGGHTKGEKYGKYAVAIQKSVPWIKEQIANSNDGSIRIKASDLGKDMGGDFVKKNPTSLYWGIKYVMFNEGVVVDSGTHKSGDKLLVMRMGTEEDHLPPSLSKYRDSVEEEETDSPVDKEDAPEE